jgi:4-hydroxyphenylpyruvate dioxygenase
MTEPSSLGVSEVDHVEIYVGNARQAAAYYRLLFGFDCAGYRGPETGTRDRASYLLTQGNIRIVLTTALDPDGPIARLTTLHGDSVHDVALRVADARSAHAVALSRGARTITEPFEEGDARGRLVRAAVAAYGDTIHSLIQREGYGPCEFPGFAPLHLPGGGTGLAAIDHIVGNVEDNRMDHWVRYYETVFGFRHFLTFEDKDISTEHSALRSKVVTNENGKVKFPINEPAQGLRRSQIQEYLDFHRAPGVQHIALSCRSILDTVTELRRRGVEFLDVPDAYYDNLADRVGPLQEDMTRLRDLRVLADRDDHGYLLQLFTRPVQDRPTLFFEVIQRRGSRGFGKGNFKALFEAIEREQARRGNL